MGDSLKQWERINLPYKIILEFQVVTILWRDIHVRSICFHFRWKSKVIFELFFSRSAVSNSFWNHGLQHASLSCPSPSPRVCSNSCQLSQWWHPTISSYYPLLLLSVFPSVRFVPCWKKESVDSLHKVAKALELQLWHQSFQWIFKTDFL